MIFNDSCTIYHKGENGFERFYVENVEWQGHTSIALSGNGRQLTESISIWFSKKTIASYGETWSIAKGDRIVKGECELTAIDSFGELRDYEPITVGTVEDWTKVGALSHIEVKSA